MPDSSEQLENIVTDAMMEPELSPLQAAGQRLMRALVLLGACTGIAALWWAYAPGGGPHGPALRIACYLAAGVPFVATLALPALGPIVVALLAPLLSAVPLYISGGHPYPIVLFAVAGFVIGWLVREVLRPHAYHVFPGQRWLFLLAALIAISATASILRYNPPWQWHTSVFQSQIVNMKGLTRSDATRYIWFVLATDFLTLLSICAVAGILQRMHAARARYGALLVWALLIGGLCAALVAIYQARYNVNFCANKSYYWTRLLRVNGTCTDPNALGTFIALCAPLAAAKIVYAGAWHSARAWLQRIAALLVMLVYIVALSYSGSRSGLLSAGVALVIVGVATLVWVVDRALRRVRAALVVRILIAAAIITSIASGVFFLPRAMRILDSRLQVSRSSTSLARRVKRDLRLFRRHGDVLGMIDDRMRMIYWRYARRMLDDFPVTGIGYGAYVVELPNYASAARERLHRTDNACNYYLHMGAELGLPGLAAVVLFLGTLLYGFGVGVQRWRKRPINAKHHRIALAVAVPVYIVILVFGVHTLAYEFSAGFAIVVALVGVDHMGLRAPPARRPLWVRYLIAVAVLAFIGAYAWRVVENNRGPLNGEYRMAAYGIVNETGWYKWENWEGVPFPLRYIGKTAMTVVRKRDLEVGIPIVTTYPDARRDPQYVTFYINGRKARTYRLDYPGEWALITLPVPYTTPFQRSEYQFVTIRIEVDHTWVPADVTGEDDVRQLGIAVGTFRWLTPEPEEGGWYAEEKWENERPFQWSSNYAWRKVPLSSNHFIQIPMYASNIQLRRWPLKVALYVDRKYLDTVTLRDKRWRDFRYPLPRGLMPGSTVLVEFVTSRTWVPKHFGFEDNRRLGVAVGEITTE